MVRKDPGHAFSCFLGPDTHELENLSLPLQPSSNKTGLETHWFFIKIWWERHQTCFFVRMSARNAQKCMSYVFPHHMLIKNYL